MPFTRLYTGSDGQSHIEEMDPGTHPTLQELQSATGISFSIAEPGHFSDWHTAPRLADGSLHRFGPGHVSLVEDLTGQGHTTRVSSSVPRITATVRLEDQSPQG